MLNILKGDQTFSGKAENKYWSDLEKIQSTNKDRPTEIWPNGTKVWKNDRCLMHRENGPAIEYPNGTKFWFQNDEFHRDDGPAVEWANGYKAWYKKGQLHREDGPAREFPNGTKEYWINGTQLTEEEFNDRPTEVLENGIKIWRNTAGQIHRENGPAVEYASGTKEWFRNGQFHCEDGPAIEWRGSKFWYKNGERHREDGPAIERADGTKEYWIDGKRLTKEEVVYWNFKTYVNEHKKSSEGVICNK